MRPTYLSLLLLSLYNQIHADFKEVDKPSVLLNALSVYEEPSIRQKRQCGAGGCGGGCRGYGCNSGCRGGNCGGGCRGGNCGCSNPCGYGSRLCCDNIQPRPCVNCGLHRGIFPEPVPIAAVGVGVNICCTCCMPVCAPRCVAFGCNSCGGFGYGYGRGYDYDYFG